MHHALLLIQFAIPALVYFAVSVAMRHTLSAEDIKWLLPNYMFMAGPHIALGLAAVAFSRLRRNLAANLVAANVALICFAAWLVSQVPPRETGLAWVLYLPLACLVLALAWLIRVRRSKRPRAASASTR